MNLSLSFDVIGKVSLVPGSTHDNWNFYNYPYYRIYVDNDLITERSWIWVNNDYYLNENLSLDLELGEHSILFKSLIRVNYDPKYDKKSSDYNKRFSMFYDVENLKINKELQKFEKIYDDQQQKDFLIQFEVA